MDALFVMCCTFYAFMTVWTFLFFGKDTDGDWLIPIRFIMGVFWPVIWATVLFMGFGFAIHKAVKDAKNKKPTQT